MSNPNQAAMPSENLTHNYLQWAMVASLVYLLICAVGMIGGGFKMATGDHAKELFALMSQFGLHDKLEHL